jgi:hypothetical protein
MSNSNIVRRAGLTDFNLLSRHRWDDEVARIIKASKTTQQRMADWSPELTRHRWPI